MAHIPDGVLSLPVLAAGGVLAAGAVAVSLRRLDTEDIPRTAVLSAVFFVSSLIAIPVGPTSVHPLFNGMMGVMLGWAAVPAIVVSLVIQLAFFGFGGLTALGVNIVDIAAPALFCALLFGPRLKRTEDARRASLWGAAAGATGVLLTGALVSLALALSDPAYGAAAKVVIATYLPLAGVEAALTAAAVGFLWRVAPDMLGLEAR